jgi:hypothetical protein
MLLVATLPVIPRQPARELRVMTAPPDPCGTCTPRVGAEQAAIAE